MNKHYFAAISYTSILMTIDIFTPRILSFAYKEVNQDMLFKKGVGIELEDPSSLHVWFKSFILE